MKSLTNNTLVMAVAMTLWATASMASEVSNLPVSSSEKDTISVTAATSSAPFYALSGLDAQSLAGQEMTDQDLEVVEGGAVSLIELGMDWEPKTGWHEFFSAAAAGALR